METRWKNTGLWISVASLLLLVLFRFNVVNGEELGVWNSVIQHGLEVLVLAGILSNPKEGSGFLDTNDNGIDDRFE